MRRRRGHLLFGAVLLPAIGGLALTSLHGAASSASTVAPSARPAATSFANAYVSFLNGRLAASALPDAAAGVRELAASGGRVPARYRGAVILRRLQFSGVLGAGQASAMIVARAGPRTAEAEMWLDYIGGRWLVSSFVPPDFSTLFAPAPSPMVVPPPARAAAGAFALAYADYRTGARVRPPAGLSTIEGQIAAGQDPLSGTARTRATAHLVALHMLPQGQSIPVDVLLAAGGHELSFSFILLRSGPGWQPWQFPVSQP